MLGDTIEIYINDMLVKSLIVEQYFDHLKQAFDVLKKYNMKLNPTKCLFGVYSGKFLGYMATQWGIEANPDQIHYVMNISSRTCVNDVRLVGRVVALSQFISRSFDKCHIFFIHKSKQFEHTPAYEKAL